MPKRCSPDSLARRLIALHRQLGGDIFYQCLFRHLAKRRQRKIVHQFEPLWQLSDKEKAEVAESVTRTVTAGHEAGFISERTALNELRQSADVTGVWSNITDDEIDAADDLPPDPGEMDADAEASDLRPGNEALASGGMGEKPEGGVDRRAKRTPLWG